MSDIKDEILKQSGPLPIPRKVEEASSISQLQLMAMANNIMERLNHQDSAKLQSDTVLFTKMDESASLARTAVTTAEAAHAETMEIKTLVITKFNELNGTVAKAVERLGVLETKDGKREAVALEKAVAANAVMAATKGLWMMKAPDGMTIATTLGTITAVISLIASGQLKEFFVFVAAHM